MSRSQPRRRPRTSIGYSTPDAIFVQGERLADDLMGEIDFGSMFFLLLTGRRPDDHESRMFNAVLVALADHGLTPTALAARLTYTGAPEAIQGAIAAGLLGAGSVFLGVLENAGSMLRRAAPRPGSSDTELRRLAAEIVAGHSTRRERIPGLGHPLHKQGDPRTKRLIELATLGGRGVYVRLLLLVQEEAAARSARQLPLNAAGMSAAVLCDLGIEATVLRGVAVVSRAAGLVGHIAEEARDPMGRLLWDLAEREVDHVEPDGHRDRPVTASNGSLGGHPATARATSGTESSRDDQRSGSETEVLSAFRRWYVAHESGDLAGLGDALASDVEIRSLFRREPARGREAAIGHFQSVNASFSDLRMDMIGDPAVLGNTVLAEVCFSGAFTGRLTWQDTAHTGTGQPFTVSGVARVRVFDGRVTEVQTLFDRDDWLRQIGVVERAS